MKHELFKVVFSDVGFRYNRKARYQLKVFFRYKWRSLYFETYKEVLRAIKCIDC